MLILQTGLLGLHTCSLSRRGRGFLTRTRQAAFLCIYGQLSAYFSNRARVVSPAAGVIMPAILAFTMTFKIFAFTWAYGQGIKTCVNSVSLYEWGICKAHLRHGCVRESCVTWAVIGQVIKYSVPDILCNLCRWKWYLRTSKPDSRPCFKIKKRNMTIYIRKTLSKFFVAERKAICHFWPIWSGTILWPFFLSSENPFM